MLHTHSVNKTEAQSTMQNYNNRTVPLNEHQSNHRRSPTQPNPTSWSIESLRFRVAISIIVVFHIIWCYVTCMECIENCLGVWRTFLMDMGSRQLRLQKVQKFQWDTLDTLRHQPKRQMSLVGTGSMMTIQRQMQMFLEHIEYMKMIQRWEK